MNFLRLLRALTITVLLMLSAAWAAGQGDAFQLYQQVISGQHNLEDLTPEQQRQVIHIHTLLSRSSCDGCSEDCRDARDNAESYLIDLESYINRLLRCVEGNDLTDDCYSEFRRVKSAHSDFESAVSDVSSYCD